MDNLTSQPAHLRLAIAPGVSSSQLSALLALQRAQEPEVSIAFFEVAGDELLDGLREGRYDVGVSLQGSSDPALQTRPLWIEHMAVAMPLRFPLLDQASLTCAWWYTPPTTMPSSLQSNWNASPNSKLSGTNAFVVSLPESCRHVRMKSVTAL